MRGDSLLGASLKLRCLARLDVVGDSLHSISVVRVLVCGKDRDGSDDLDDETSMMMSENNPH